MVPQSFPRLCANGQRTLVVVLLMLSAVTVEAEQVEPSFFNARVAPIFEEHCVTCHGPEKHKGKLRLDSFEQLQRGAESGEVVVAGDAHSSELFRRVSLPLTDEDVMPSDGKPQLSSAEIKVLELWLAGGASLDKPVSAFPDAPPLRLKNPPVVPLTGDWTSAVPQIRSLEKQLGLKLAPRSLVVSDGLVLRTASAPWRCDDATLAKLAPIAEFVVEAELARTKITDSGLQTLARWENLRAIDLTRTAVSSKGVSALTALQKLERLNLTSTAVDVEGQDALKKLPNLQHLWAFETKVAEAK